MLVAFRQDIALLIGKADCPAVRCRSCTVVRRGKRPVNAVDGSFALKVGSTIGNRGLLIAAHKVHLQIAERNVLVEQVGKLLTFRKLLSVVHAVDIRPQVIDKDSAHVVQLHAGIVFAKQAV